MPCLGGGIALPLVAVATLGIGAPVVAVAAGVIAVGALTVMAGQLSLALGEELGRQASMTRPLAELGRAGVMLRRYQSPIPAMRLARAAASRGLQVGGSAPMADGNGGIALYALLLLRDGQVVGALRHAPVAGRQATELIVPEQQAALVRDVALTAVREAFQEAASDQQYAFKLVGRASGDRVRMGAQRVTDADRRIVVDGQWAAGMLQARMETEAHNDKGEHPRVGPDTSGFLRRIGLDDPDVRQFWLTRGDPWRPFDPTSGSLQPELSAEAHHTQEHLTQGHRG